MTPKDILEKLIRQATGISEIFRRRKSKPGEMVEFLKPEEREILKDLTSNDAAENHLRLDTLYGADWNDTKKQKDQI